MPLEGKCGCPLCDIETQLLSELNRRDGNAMSEMFADFPALLRHSSISSLLSHLRTSSTDSGSDELFRELFALRETTPAFVDGFFVLVFLPMLHRTIRLVARQQQSLAEEDITQQVLSFLLQFLRSSGLHARRSHFAFAIARDVKRHIFEWANRESAKAAVLDHRSTEMDMFLAFEDHRERYALLRHFLRRCIMKGLLADSELALLIQFKLGGNTGRELAALNGSSSNAVRQRFKRLLAKLRRLAR